MLDFISISAKPKNGVYEVTPSFKVIKSKDLMIRGNTFYGIWDEKQQYWTTDEFDAIRLIDEATLKYTEERYGDNAIPKLLIDADNGLIDKWNKYCQKQAINNYQSLDETLQFSNMERKRENLSSKSLPYPLEQGDHSAWDALINVLYAPAEKHKIEWAIGCIVSGDSKWIQKFMVMYGSAGTGKSTILNIIEDLFQGYHTAFDAKVLGNNSNAFALEAFRTNPLVAIQHDGDLSRIEDNTKLNSLVSHETMVINEKFKSAYNNSFKAFLFMGTNKPVKITDAKSGLIRRLIDVKPTGNKLQPTEYRKQMKLIPFQLSGIAQHCLDVYMEDKDYYNSYVPVDMLGASNDFYNFISDNYHIFAEAKDVPLTLGWDVYKQYVEDANMPYPLSKRAFREEFANYFAEFKDRHILEDGKRVRSYYLGFLTDKFESLNSYDHVVEIKTVEQCPMGLKEQQSVFDRVAINYAAQLTTDEGFPRYKWDKVRTQLKDINTKELHFVKVPENHIVIDFDIPNPDGTKSLEKNLEAASKFPKTYTELSKSGNGVHLHYYYRGDVDQLSRVYDEHIEVKVYKGNSSLRRKLTKCNDEEISTISSGLPLREAKKVVDKQVLKNEKMLRVMILRNLKKEYHSATRPSMDFINKLLNDAYESGMAYDVTELRPAILSFAMDSTNQAKYCIGLIDKMKFKSEEASYFADSEHDSIVFYDVEVFPNLFLVNWKFQGEGKTVHRMINPKPKDIEMLTHYRLVGFNNRRYDNHMLYACMMGYSVDDIYNLSQRIISNSPNALFAEAYNLSYADVYCFSTKKQSLKKWEIELGLKHHELGLPWDQPVPEDMWLKVAEYCDDDVLATEAVWDKLSADWSTRQILAEMAGKSPNTSTNALTTQIIFGNNRAPQNEFYYRNLALPIKEIGKDIPEDVYEYIMNETCLDGDFTAWTGEKSKLPFFPGYKFENGKSTYRGIEVGEGGFVKTTEGIHENAALLDVTSQHPNSANNECLFGPRYTAEYYGIVKGRVALKNKDIELAKKIANGKFAPFIVDDASKLEALALAFKIPINSVYGLTSASFINPFKHPDNKDNIVAKRGALFMIDLMFAVQEKGFTVAHIKTDSIKIPNATPEIIQFVHEFGKKYGYGFEHEATYEKMCLVNKAVYICKYAQPEKCMELYGYVPGDNKKKPGKWDATGTQFAVPYVFKTLFSHEPIVPEDMCESKEVKTAMHLEFEDGSRKFIGKVGQFSPVIDGALLVREATDKKTGNIKYDSVVGTKGHKWIESTSILESGDTSIIDKTYYTNLVDNALDSIAKYGDAETFLI